ncbi:MarR family transcriptional regulator [Bifidobacterium aemilianum]|uniref:MarR family transcriptional regulator n=1 Tax=Bifidobacterium aemilianum TaxID=2493120 RepID=A0A366KAH7_9BIFI|nr:transcriptional regulator [Bifidobacterium aemilianum]RBP98148.1 MarR family transcriptional regulator [Bifidobacterium aemilianum]
MSSELDPIIHATSRLRIMTVLSRVGQGEEISFERLRQLLNMTPGNLSVHLSKLEGARYLKQSKTFEGRKPITYITLSAKGAAAYQEYLEQLTRLLSGADSDSLRS